MGEAGGIDVVLQALAAYKKNDPQSDEEAEMVENLFDVICSVIMLEGAWHHAVISRGSRSAPINRDREEQSVPDLSFSPSSPENRLRFLEAEGVELMCLMLRSKNMCRFGAMRVRPMLCLLELQEFVAYHISHSSCCFRPLITR